MSAHGAPWVGAILMWANPPKRGAAEWAYRPSGPRIEITRAGASRIERVMGLQYARNARAAADSCCETGAQAARSQSTAPEQHVEVFTRAADCMAKSSTASSPKVAGG